MSNRENAEKSIEKVCKKSAGKTKRPCVTPSRYSAGAFVVFVVQFGDDLAFPVGQLPHPGGGVGVRGGLFGGRNLVSIIIQMIGFHKKFGKNTYNIHY